MVKRDAPHAPRLTAVFFLFPPTLENVPILEAVERTFTSVRLAPKTESIPFSFNTLISPRRIRIRSMNGYLATADTDAARLGHCNLSVGEERFALARDPIRHLMIHSL